MKKLIPSLLALIAIAIAPVAVQAAHHEDMDHSEITPSSVIHVVTVSWKSDASDADIQAALDGVVTLAKEFDGIERVWIKTIKAQGERSHAFVMEFKSEQALKDYAGSDAQKKWYKVYLPARDRSTTFDITNS
ncbi:Dabb family protein [Pelagicoccus sp. SDUM812003]|uniref:Dabb family protein n=1 Tax=Pelagicoccus sp. SDUM812003 TaxID=3041267 RepID=UPI00280FA651|nr:Dabb family protein [Pelagicoccus sp. SDUM812003]MDQ8204526.1 Dabb family protein [Pelagicoccus sp. SDUM812003]